MRMPTIPAAAPRTRAAATATRANGRSAGPLLRTFAGAAACGWAVDAGVASEPDGVSSAAAATGAGTAAGSVTGVDGGGGN